MRGRVVGMAALASIAGAAAAQPAPAPGEVVVRGTRAKLSAWRQAETAHVLLIGDGPEAELARLARNLERLHFLLSGLLGRGAAADDTVRLRITLIGDVAGFDAMDLRNARWQQGPFNDLFRLARYYDPREDGAVMATTRVDQRTVIEHTRANAQSVLAYLGGMNQPSAAPGGADALVEQGAVIGDLATADFRGPHDLPVTFGEHAIDVPAESLLYAGYAQHFLLTYFPAAYPRWYLDGFAQIFASFEVRRDGGLVFGRSPTGTGAVLEEFGPFPLKEVLDDSYLRLRPGSTGWTPIHAWLLTHFLFFSDTRRPQLRQYLVQRANGADAATAARVFGDPDGLARELRGYFGARKPYEVVHAPADAAAEPAVRRLNEAEAAFVNGRLELGARILVPPAPTPGTDPATAERMLAARADALAARARWLDRLAREAMRWPNEPEAQLLLAEATCRSGEGDACLAAATRAEALAPTDARARTWHGLALAEQAVTAPPAERVARLAAARTMIAAANHADTDAVEPLLAYYRTFALAGEPPTPAAVAGEWKAVDAVPDAPESRLALATGLLALGRDADARAVALPVAAGPYSSPEQPAAKAVVAKAGAVAATPTP